MVFDGRHVSTSSRCAKMKPKYPGYGCCHLELLTSFGTRTDAVVIGEWTCGIKRLQINTVYCRTTSHFVCFKQTITVIVSQLTKVILLLTFLHYVQLPKRSLQGYFTQDKRNIAKIRKEIAFCQTGGISDTFLSIMQDECRNYNQLSGC